MTWKSESGKKILGTIFAHKFTTRAELNLKMYWFFPHKGPENKIVAQTFLDADRAFRFKKEKFSGGKKNGEIGSKGILGSLLLTFLKIISIF